MKLIGIALVLISFAEKFRGDVTDGNLFRFINDKATANTPDEPVKDKCIIKLIREAYSQLGNTYIFIADDHEHEELLHNLQLNFVHSYFTDPTSSPSSSDSRSFYHLLIFRKRFDLNNVIGSERPPQNTKIFVLVRSYREVLERFRVLWRYRLVHAVASFVEGRHVYYYTYFPYWRTHCGRVGEPYLLAKCDIFTGEFSRKEKLFPPKVKDLHGCHINVTLKENVPSSYYSGSNKLIGWEVDLVSELLERINGIPNFKTLRLAKVYRIGDGYQRLVKQSEIGGGLAVTLKSLSKTDFCIYGMSLCILWIIPDWKGNAYSFNFLINVFPVEVWVLLFLTYLVMVVLIRLLLKASFDDIAFKLVPFLLGTTTRVKRMSKRVGALWLWFCLIVNAIYQSGYQSRLLVPHTPPKHIRTSDVLRSELKILGVADVMTDLVPFFKQRYNVSERRFQDGAVFSYEDWIYRMTIKKDSAYFGFKETVRYHIDKTELAREIHIPETCEIKYLLTLVLKKNSHLTETLALLANRLNENGFLDYYVRKHLSRESRRNFPSKLTAILKPKHGFRNSTLPPPINMDKILIVFMCLVMGISLAFMAFLIELIYKRCCDKITKIHTTPRQPPFPWAYID